MKASSEKTDTDRNRERRLKKLKKKEKKKEKKRRAKLVEKLNPGLGNKYSKEKAKRELEKQSKMGKGVTMIEASMSNKRFKCCTGNEVQNWSWNFFCLIEIINKF